MANESERIQLAELMGVISTHDAELMQCRPDAGNLRHIPDPLTDANDDYAVLEWMRILDETGMRDDYLAFMKFIGVLPENWRYKVGDYARAALKVINND